jgi:hypothetical protein
MRAAERAAPLSSYVHVFFGYALLDAGRYNEAARECEQASADHEIKNECLGRANCFPKTPACILQHIVVESAYNADAKTVQIGAPDHGNALDQGPILHP